MEGWIKLHRQSLDSSVWKNPRVWFVWCWCLIKATHKKYKFPFGGKDIELMPGQFIAGRNKALEEMPGLTSQNYRTAINYLKSTNRITTKVTNKFTIISICNWDKYQDKVTNKLTKKVTSDSPTTNQQVTTYKNVKNVKNKRIYNKLSDLKEKDFQEISEKYEVPIAFVRSKYDDMVLWKGEKSGRGRGRNWRLTLMNWVKRDAIKIRKEGYDPRQAIDARSIIAAKKSQRGF